MKVKRKVVYMGERDVIQEARTMIKTLRTAFSRDFIPSPDALRFEENLNHILEVFIEGKTGRQSPIDRVGEVLSECEFIDWFKWTAFE